MRGIWWRWRWRWWCWYLTFTVMDAYEPCKSDDPMTSVVTSVRPVPCGGWIVCNLRERKRETETENQPVSTSEASAEGFGDVMAAARVSFVARTCWASCLWRSTWAGATGKSVAVQCYPSTTRSAYVMRGVLVEVWALMAGVGDTSTPDLPLTATAAVVSRTAQSRTCRVSSSQPASRNDRINTISQQQRTCTLSRIMYSARGKTAVVTSSVFLLVWLSVCLSLRSLVSKTTRPYFTKFSVHATCGRGWSFSDGSAIRYVLPVLWMTSCFHIRQGIGQNQRRHVCFVQFSRWRHWGEVCCLRLHVVSWVALEITDVLRRRQFRMGLGDGFSQYITCGIPIEKSPNKWPLLSVYCFKTPLWLAFVRLYIWRRTIAALCHDTRQRTTQTCQSISKLQVYCRRRIRYRRLTERANIQSCDLEVKISVLETTRVQFVKVFVSRQSLGSRPRPRPSAARLWKIYTYCYIRKLSVHCLTLCRV